MNVLLIDDSALSRMMIRSLLQEKFPDCIIAEAPSGDEALKITQPQAFDLITIDINMPGMDSFEAARQLHEKYPEAKLAVITANIQNSIRKKIQSLGIMFIAVIEKPITQERMEKIIEAL
jgi:two-component system chemotaxis response regulator CheY